MDSPFTSCIQWVTLQQNLTSRSPKNLPTPWGEKEEKKNCVKDHQETFEENICRNNTRRREWDGLGKYSLSHKAVYKILGHPHNGCKDNHYYTGVLSRLRVLPGKLELIASPWFAM